MYYDAGARSLPQLVFRISLVVSVVGIVRVVAVAGRGLVACFVAALILLAVLLILVLGLHIFVIAVLGVVRVLILISCILCHSPCLLKSYD